MTKWVCIKQYNDGIGVVNVGDIVELIYNSEDYFENLLAYCYRTDEQTREVLIEEEKRLRKCNKWIDDHFMPFAEYRQKRIDEILNDE